VGARRVRNLLGDTIPFLVLGALIALGRLLRVVTVALVVALVSGLGVWRFAPSNSVTIGASGVVCGTSRSPRWRLCVGSHTAFRARPDTGVRGRRLFGAVGGVLAGRILCRCCWLGDRLTPQTTRGSSPLFRSPV
jgi:hypothetical protein